MNEVPDSVCSSLLSLNSLSCCTCGASSEPNVAVAIRHPPPLVSSVIFSSVIFSSVIFSSVIFSSVIFSSVIFSAMVIVPLSRGSIQESILLWK